MGAAQQFLVLGVPLLHLSPLFIPTHMQNIHDLKVDFDENPDGLIIQKSQNITQEYLDSLKAHRFESKHRPSGDYLRVASIPVVVIEKWMREGFDFYNEPASKIVAKLKSDGLDGFLTTDKQV
jgi:hypothetical protein